MKPLYNVGWLLVTNTYLIKCAQCVSRITIIEYDHSQKIGQPNKLKGYYVTCTDMKSIVELKLNMGLCLFRRNYYKIVNKLKGYYV
jgi:hypothetical protein